jgi:hypothetical protein
MQLLKASNSICSTQYLTMAVVGIGDFNNDNLPDIYFTASVQPNINNRVT